MTNMTNARAVELLRAMRDDGGVVDDAEWVAATDHAIAVLSTTPAEAQVVGGGEALCEDEGCPHSGATHICVTACGGCGNADPDKRCVGCMHQFTSTPIALSAQPRSNHKLFPINVMGGPMREFSPGKWESAVWPSEQPRPEGDRTDSYSRDNFEAWKQRALSAEATVEGMVRGTSSAQPPSASVGVEAVASHMEAFVAKWKTCSMTELASYSKMLREALAQQPASAPVGVEGLAFEWEKRAGELSDEGLYGCCAGTYEQCAAAIRALAQQPAAPNISSEHSAAGSEHSQPAAVNWRAMYRFQTAMRYMDNMPDITRAAAFRMADEDCAGLEFQPQGARP